MVVEVAQENNNDINRHILITGVTVNIMYITRRATLRRRRRPTPVDSTPTLYITTTNTKTIYTITITSTTSMTPGRMEKVEWNSPG